jgi:hypothetical protein
MTDVGSRIKENLSVGTGLVPVLTLMRTATRAVPTSTTPDSIYHFYELSNSPQGVAPTKKTPGINPDVTLPHPNPYLFLNQSRIVIFGYPVQHVGDLLFIP